MTPEAGGRIAILDPLRGLAAFAVMWYHFTWTAPLLDNAEGASAWIRATGAGGWLGVEVFFVISGFVLPYAMWRGRYRLRDYGRFLTKRLIRLEPPYVVALVITVGLWIASSMTPWFAGEQFVFEWKQFALHFAYLNAFFGHPWYNTVFWTLAIEFQFYLLIALLFPLALHRRLWVRAALPLCLAAVAFLPASSSLVFYYLALFGLGLATAQHFIGVLPRRAYVPIFCILGAIAFSTLMVSQAAVGVATAAFIAAFASADTKSLVGRVFGWRPLVWLGMISYSVYLIHHPIGGRVVNVGARITDGLLGQLVVLALALAVSLIASYVIYKWVERPSQLLSGKLKYRGEKGRPQAAEEHSILAEPGGDGMAGQAEHLYTKIDTYAD